MRRTPHAARHAWRTMGSSPQALCSRRMAPCTASIASCAILNPQRRRAREAAESNRIRGPPRCCGEPPAAARQAKARVDKPAVYPLRFLSTPRRQKRAYNFICTLMRELTFIACVLPFSGAATAGARTPARRARRARARFRASAAFPFARARCAFRRFRRDAPLFSFYTLEINHRLLPKTSIS